MAIGKQWKGKQGGKMKIRDAFEDKEWYHVKAPNTFKEAMQGRPCVTKSRGTRLARDSLLRRVFTVTLADLNKSEDSFRKIQLECLDVQGNQLLTNFYSMDFTTDKLRGMVKKWQTTIEASADVKTADGYKLRLFAIGFTERRGNRKTSYAQRSQIKAIRKKMIEIMKREAESVELHALVQKFVPETIGEEIKKATQGIYPLYNVFIRKVKTLSAPKMDASRLLELHGGAEAIADYGKPIERVDDAPASDDEE
jgi:small subunit ribosomal protein S3Ae